MGELHAIPIALREKSPKIFEEKIKPYLKPIDLYVKYDSNYDITKVSCYIFLTNQLKKKTSLYEPFSNLVSEQGSN